MYEDELQLTMYRHWSLFESFCHSINFASKFKVWTLKGQKRMHEFLAEMGYDLISFFFVCLSILMFVHSSEFSLSHLSFLFFLSSLSFSVSLPSSFSVILHQNKDEKQTPGT